jgi:hypothetical protein
MHDEDWSIDLPRTAAEWSDDPEGDLDTVLENELIDMRSDLAEGGCESGGMPDDEQVSVSELEIDGQHLTASVTVDFTEVVPSGCPELPHRERRERRLVLRLARGSSVGALELSSSDPQGWSIQDRNSAADGA